MPDPLPSAVVVIPARLGSTRFPHKVIAARTGRPLVQHVVDRVRACRYVAEVVVATDSEKVADALAPFGTAVVMTDAAHESGTDRVAEVMRSRAEPIVVNVQGDEPEIDPATVDGLIGCLSRADTGHPDMATAVTPFPVAEDVADPARVKAVVAWRDERIGRAVYFSRSPVPHHRDGGPGDYYLHLGIYAYRRDFLLRFAGWPPSPLERAEKLEQLRAVERGASIAVLKVDHAGGGIDTPGQYDEFVKRRGQVEGGGWQ